MSLLDDQYERNKNKEKEQCDLHIVSKRFRFSYRVDYRRFSVELDAENLNKAMVEFATYYHEIDEVYSIEKVNVC